MKELPKGVPVYLFHVNGTLLTKQFDAQMYERKSTIILEFKFDDTWDDYINRFVVFNYSNGTKQEAVILNKDNRCMFPEVLKDVFAYTLNIYAETEDRKLRRASQNEYIVQGGEL